MIDIILGGGRVVIPFPHPRNVNHCTVATQVNQ
jgi:hypothetical protein